VTSRREARRVAIDVLYQADVTTASPLAVLDDWAAAGRDVPPFARALVEGVDAHGPSIDLLLETHATGWTVARMAAVDRTILRVAVEEVRYRDDVPDAVAQCVRVRTTVEPDPAWQSAYEDIYPRFGALYPALDTVKENPA